MFAEAGGTEPRAPRSALMSCEKTSNDTALWKNVEYRSDTKMKKGEEKKAEEGRKITPPVVAYTPAEHPPPPPPPHHCPPPPRPYSVNLRLPTSGVLVTELE